MERETRIELAMGFPAWLEARCLTVRLLSRSPREGWSPSGESNPDLPHTKGLLDHRATRA